MILGKNEPNLIFQLIYFSVFPGSYCKIKPTLNTLIHFNTVAPPLYYNVCHITLVQKIAYYRMLYFLAGFSCSSPQIYLLNLYTIPLETTEMEMSWGPCFEPSYQFFGQSLDKLAKVTCLDFRTVNLLTQLGSVHKRPQFGVTPPPPSPSAPFDIPPQMTSSFNQPHLLFPKMIFGKIVLYGKI